GQAFGVVGDVTDEAPAACLVADAVARHGRLDILVNNVGGSRNAKIWEMALEDWDFTIRLNLRGTFLCTRAAVPHMMKQRSGRIVCLSSGAREGTPWTAYYQGGSAYSAAKAGVHGFIRDVALELAEYGINVNAVAPGPATPVSDAAVVIDGERIIAAGPRTGLTWPPDADVVDVSGRTVIPGLIDAHDHMASHGYALATRWGLDEPASTAHLRTARVLADTLAMGYTTVRDAGGLDAGFKVAIEHGLIPGPRLVLGIQIISPTGGIGDRVSPSGHGWSRAYDPLL